MLGFTTMAIHALFLKKDPHGLLHMPVYDLVSCEFETAEDVEDPIADLTGALED